jgi:hypothetical protein
MLLEAEEHHRGRGENERGMTPGLGLHPSWLRSSTSALQYADDVSGSGVALYQRVCEMDLEGIVAGRHELFEQERHREPVPGWHCCDLACVGVDQNG